MNKRIVLCLFVAGISFAVAPFIPTTATIKGLLALPGAAGLLTVLWETIKSRIEHDHRLQEDTHRSKLALEEDASRNAFILSATSHMAQTAFDKHVAFCEEYVGAVNDGLMELLKEGPSMGALTFATKLFTIRRTYLLWETAEVVAPLDAFETALRQIGAGMDYADKMPAGPQRSAYVEKVFATFSAVLDIKPLPYMKSPEIAASQIIERLRDHLGITKLTSLRKHYLDEATKRAVKPAATFPESADP